MLKLETINDIYEAIGKKAKFYIFGEEPLIGYISNIVIKGTDGNTKILIHGKTLNDVNIKWHFGIQEVELSPQDDKSFTQNELYDALMASVTKKLNAIGVPNDCPTRELSYDEAHLEMLDTAERLEEVDENSRLTDHSELIKMYKEAAEIYNVGSTLWMAMDDNNLINY